MNLRSLRTCANLEPIGRHALTLELPHRISHHAGLRLSHMGANRSLLCLIPGRTNIVRTNGFGKGVAVSRVGGSASSGLFFLWLILRSGGCKIGTFMTTLDNPILNSPFSVPTRHWALDERGMPTGASEQGRRRSEFIIPIAKSRRTGEQGELRYSDVEGPAATRANDLVNEIRTQVDNWRAATATPAGVTYETARLILHWRDKARERPLFFCQVEAAETVIWLTEVARRNHA